MGAARCAGRRHFAPRPRGRAPASGNNRSVPLRIPATARRALCFVGCSTLGGSGRRRTPAGRSARCVGAPARQRPRLVGHGDRVLQPGQSLGRRGSQPPAALLCSMPLPRAGPSHRRVRVPPGPRGDDPHPCGGGPHPLAQRRWPRPSREWPHPEAGLGRPRPRFASQPSPLPVRLDVTERVDIGGILVPADHLLQADQVRHTGHRGRGSSPRARPDPRTRAHRPAGAAAIPAQSRPRRWWPPQPAPGRSLDRGRTCVRPPGGTPPPAATAPLGRPTSSPGWLENPHDGRVPCRRLRVRL